MSRISFCAHDALLLALHRSAQILCTPPRRLTVIRREVSKHRDHVPDRSSHTNHTALMLLLRSVGHGSKMSCEPGPHAW